MAAHRTQTLVHRLVASTLLLTLSACASYRDIGTRAELRTADSFATQQTFHNSSSEWPSQQWWQQFHDAQLNALIEEALAHNPTLDAAAARVRAAQAHTGTARSYQSPEINASADISYQKLSETWIFPPPYGGSSLFNNTLRLNAAYEIDFWGKNRAAVRAATSQERAAEAEQQSATLLLTSNLCAVYIELGRLLAERDLLAQTLQQRETIFTLTQQRVAAGIDNRADVKQAESQLPSTRGQLAQIDEAIGAARNALAALLGAGPDRGLSIQPPQLGSAQFGATQTDATKHDIQLPNNLPVDLLGRRPDIVAARWQAEAAQQHVDVAKAMFYPNVSLTGYVGFSSLGIDNLVKPESAESGIGPAIRLPIFAGGRLRQNLRSEYANYENAVANYNATLTTALREVADQLNALHALRNRQQEQQQAASIAHSALNFATQRYEAGIGNYLSVLSAQTIVLNQDRLGVELNMRALELQVALIKALGGGYTARQYVSGVHHE